MAPINRLAFVALLCSLAITSSEAGKNDKRQVKDELEPIDPEEGLRCVPGQCMCCVPTFYYHARTSDS